MNMLYQQIIVNSQDMLTFKFFQELWTSLWCFHTPPHIDHRDWFIIHRLMLHRLVNKICPDGMLPDIAHYWSRLVYAILLGCFLECTPVIFAPWCIHVQLPEFFLGRWLLSISFPFCALAIITSAPISVQFYLLSFFHNPRGPGPYDESWAAGRAYDTP